MSVFALLPNSSSRPFSLVTEVDVDWPRESTLTNPSVATLDPPPTRATAAHARLLSWFLDATVAPFGGHHIHCIPAPHSRAYGELLPVLASCGRAGGDKRSRAAKVSSTAKKAAAIAAAEGKEDETAYEKKVAEPHQKDESDDQKIGTGEEPEGTVDIDWSGDDSLTWTMISHITDDDDTRRSLFPPPGSTKRNGGLSKKHYHFLLAKNCFEDHPVYGEAFKNAVAAKQGDVWAGKIKNRVKAVTDKTREGVNAMGETGAGLESADDIEAGSGLQTKWEAVPRRRRESVALPAPRPRERELPHELREPRIIKAGRSVNADLRRLATACGQPPGSFTGPLELGNFAKDRFLITRANMSLVDLVASILGQRFPQHYSERISSNWSDSDLTTIQQQYAARDAYAALVLYRKINEIPLPVPMDQLTPCGASVLLLTDDNKKLAARGVVSPAAALEIFNGTNLTSTRTVITVQEVLLPGAIIGQNDKKRSLTNYDGVWSFCVNEVERPPMDLFSRTDVAERVMDELGVAMRVRIRSQQAFEVQVTLKIPVFLALYDPPKYNISKNQVNWTTIASMGHVLDNSTQTNGG
ncbi:hypothetical protein B0H14DRAFT_2645135 [Mycena olivaceomarginata]|nr:hypothetical protein B0H14DRAFT_2645135 [Mycena olivaceomarginata]